MKHYLMEVNFCIFKDFIVLIFGNPLPKKQSRIDNINDVIKLLKSFLIFGSIFVVNYGNISIFTFFFKTIGIYCYTHPNIP